jgi:hypothetical protein
MVTDTGLRAAARTQWHEYFPRLSHGPTDLL